MKPLTHQQKCLTEQHIRLAHKISNRFSKHYPWLEQDFSSLSQWALMRASQSFNPALKLSFTSYAHFKITSALTDFTRKQFRYKEILEDFSTQAKQFHLDNSIYESYDCNEWIHKLFSKLHWRQHKIMTLKYIDRLNNKEIAERLKIKEMAVRHLTASSNKQLRAFFDREHHGVTVDVDRKKSEWMSIRG